MLKFLLSLCAAGIPALLLGSQPATLESPDGQLQLQFDLSDQGTPTYSLSFKGRPVIRDSRLGFEIRGDLNVSQIEIDSLGRILKRDAHPCFSLHDRFEKIDEHRGSFDETWRPVWGEEEQIQNHYNEWTVDLRQKESGQEMSIRFRLYDDGLGFRYEFPAQKGFEYFIIREELTQFAMAEDYTAFWIPGDYDTQEYEYTVSRISQIPERLPAALTQNPHHTPFSVNAVQTSLQMRSDDGLYVNIHEAALVDYPCMHLEINPQTLTFTASLTPDAMGWKGTMQTPRHTPWRTIQVADNACGILASRLILNLNDPCAYDDVSWIHPIKYVGVWWEMISGAGSWAYTDQVTSVDLARINYADCKPSGRHSARTENVRRYIDFAAENGFDEVLVEGWNIGWEDWEHFSKEEVFDFVTPYPDFDIEGLNRYAREKGVKLLMHHETSSAVRSYERHLDAAYDLMQHYGYDAVKSGYVGSIYPRGEHHYGQWMNNHYLYAVRKAAEHRIMVNAHEAVRPTGLCRTYPNLIGNESAKGTEYQAFGGLHPQHVTILPFTRLNGGPMDYTPGIFVMRLQEFSPANTSHVNATICNQLALYLTMYSPLQMAADLPEHYMRYADAFQFIRDVAVDWRQSRYLMAEPGDYIVVARQAKESGQWFAGGVTDENRRTLLVPLDFLEPGTAYEATIYTDAENADYRTNPQAYRILRKRVDARSKLTLTLAPGGGFAISFRKIEK